MAWALRRWARGAVAAVHADERQEALVAATAALARAVSIPVIASGGLAGLQDVHDLIAVADSGIVGAISGRALYDGRLSPADVLALEGVVSC